MNKKEAEKELGKKLNEQADVFCPLIRDNCVTECVCLVNKIVDGKFDDGRVECNPIVYCDNYMFFGPE